MLTLPSRAICVRIEASFDTAYAQLSDPATWPHWAAGLGAGLTPGETGVWTINTVEGEAAQVRFSAPNDFGVLDHTVILPGGREVPVPMRLVRNGDGCEVVFSLMKAPGMDDTAFEANASAVARDLAALKASLEALA